ncbi:MAG: arginine--tRNA ligase [Anaerolineae bacterium]|nr:arginine--tRNA ligase [Anaerolineae bacterium]
MTFTPIPQRIEGFVRDAIAAAQQAGKLPAADAIAVPINRPKKADQGDYACPAPMALAKTFGLKPLDIAQTIADHMPQNELLREVIVAAPGFLNFWLNRDWVREQIHTIIKADDKIFQQDIGKNRRVNVEFLSANPTGPLHVGRTRGAVVGDGIARLMEMCGWNVYREYYFNNGGRQMTLLGQSLQARYLQALGIDAELPKGGYEGEYHSDMGQKLAGEKGDEWKNADWSVFKEYAEQEIFRNIENTLDRLGIHFDLFFPELSLYGEPVEQVRAELEKRGYLYYSPTRHGASEEDVAAAKAKNLAPALWFKSTEFGDDEDRIILRSTGEPTYVLPDIAYHVNKLGRGFDLCIDIFGSDHFTEAQTVNRGLQALGYDADKVKVVLTQWVQLMREGQPVGMSTRKGEVVNLDDLINEIGPDAVRYFMLNRSTDATINFDLGLAVKASNENPVFYIQNAHVRCAGILRQVEERGYPNDWDKDADLSLLGESETAFILKMLEFPDQLVFAHDNLAPHQMAFWALDLARAFHPLYDEIRVLHSEVPEDVAKARLKMYRAAKIVFKRVLTLMGMTAPERM